MLNLLWQELRARRSAMLIWGVALSMIPVIYIGLYPAFADQLSNFTEMLDLPFYQALGIQMGTFEEYMASTATNLIPLILAIYAVTTGTAALAGEEEDGRLELIVALPIPRWQIVAVKAVAIGITLLIILAITGAGAALTLLALGDQVETVVTPFKLFTSLVAAWPLEMAFAMISLFLGAFCSTRRIATGLAILTVLGSYFGNNMTGFIEALEPLKGLFLFDYYDAWPMPC